MRATETGRLSRSHGTEPRRSVRAPPRCETVRISPGARERSHHIMRRMRARHSFSMVDVEYSELRMQCPYGSEPPPARAGQPRPRAVRLAIWFRGSFRSIYDPIHRKPLKRGIPQEPNRRDRRNVNFRSQPRTEARPPTPPGSSRTHTHGEDMISSQTPARARGQNLIPLLPLIDSSPYDDFSACRLGLALGDGPARP